MVQLCVSVSVTCNKHACAEMKSLSNRCVSVSPPQNGTDSAASPLGMVQIPRVCHPVSPCVTLCRPVSPCATLLTGVEEKEVLTQGGTG